MSTQATEVSDACSDCWISGSAGTTSDCRSEKLGRRDREDRERQVVVRAIGLRCAVDIGSDEMVQQCPVLKIADRSTTAAQ